MQFSRSFSRIASLAHRFKTLPKERKVYSGIGALSLTLIGALYPKVSMAKFSRATLVETEVEGRHFEIQYPANNPIEDRFATHSLKNADGYCASVFDGHGGWQISEYASNNLHGYIDQEFKALGKKSGFSEEEIHKVLNNAFDRVESDIRAVALHAYQFNFPQLCNIGSCCLCTLVVDGKIYVANIGDCRGVLLEEGDNGTIEFIKMNTNMTAISKKEQERLRAAFPDDEDIIVMRRNNPKAQYVKGRLMPTRAFGDLHLKYEEFNNPRNFPRNYGFRSQFNPFRGPYITHKPEIKVFPVSPNSIGYVLASDGLWDEMKARDIAGVYSNYKDQASSLISVLLENALKHAAEDNSLTLEEMKEKKAGSARRNVHDDITIMFVSLKDTQPIIEPT